MESMNVVRDKWYLRTLESTNVKLSAEVMVLREQQTSIEVSKKEKRGLETKFRVLEELREKVRVRIEAEVDVGGKLLVFFHPFSPVR